MFKDHFSDKSVQYRQYRPQYPRELFRYLASIAPSTNKAWDCACGTGQSAQGLKEYFKDVIATDASKNQIEQAKQAQNITYKISAAEKTNLQNGEIDVITVAQALHWLDLPAFFKETDRVLTDKGILAVWTYNLMKINREIDKIINRLYHEVLGQYWPPERTMVEDGYKSIDFPFNRITPPSFTMRADWNLDQFLGYLETWSALKKYAQNNSPREIELCFDEIKASWKNPGSTHTVTWPLTVILRRKEENETSSDSPKLEGA